MDLSRKLAEMNIVLPKAPPPVASYVPAVIHDNLCFTSGQLPFRDGEIIAQGKLGNGITIEEGYSAARQAAINAVSAAAAAVGGLDKLTGVVKVVGLVQSHEDFHDQPKVINGASEFFEQLFGEAGRHARTASGTNALPLNAAVEVECIFRWTSDGY